MRARLPENAGSAEFIANVNWAYYGNKEYIFFVPFFQQISAVGLGVGDAGLLATCCTMLYANILASVYAYRL